MTNALDGHRSSHIQYFMRGVADILFIILAIVGPWWLALLLGFGLIFFLGAYEIVIGGLLMDMIYTTGVSTLSLGDFLFTAAFLVAISAAYYIRRGTKKYLRM